MATVTNFANAFETTLTADMLGTDLTAQVQTTDGAPTSPCYLVIDPHNDDKREYVLFDGSFTTTSFATTALANRYLAGSAAASGITHAAGAIVRFAPVAQHFSDLHERVTSHTDDPDLGSAGPHNAQFAATVRGVSVTGLALDGVTNDLPALQAAIDGLGGDRGTLYLPDGDLFCDGNLDMKRALIEGNGPRGTSGAGGTRLIFSGMNGIFSSVEDNYGYGLRGVQVIGSATSDPATWQNGQTLVNFTGQNYPRLYDVRLNQAETGLKLAKGSSVECNYGHFERVDCNYCYVGVLVDAGLGGLTNSHTWVSGRVWECTTGVNIPGTSNNLLFLGVTFELGAAPREAVRSKGTNVTFVGCRWETSGGNLHVLADAGRHFLFGNHWSSGEDVVDDNLPSVVWGLDGVGDSRAALAPLAGGNLAANGNFRYDTDADGVGDEWVVSYSTLGSGYTASLVADTLEPPGRMQRLENAGADNLRVGQQVRVIPNVPHVVRYRYDVDVGTAQLRIGSSNGGTEVASVGLTVDGVLRENRTMFTPTTDTVWVTLYLPGTTTRTADFAGVVVTPGIGAAGSFVSRPLGESGGTVYGDTTHRGVVTYRGRSIVQPDSGSPTDLARSFKKLGLVGGATATLNLDFNDIGGFVAVVFRLWWSTNTGLQAVYRYALLHISGTTTGGGTAIQQVFNNSTGNFQSATTDFAVTRPSTRRLTVTYTRSGTDTGADMNVEAVVLDAVNLSAAALA